ncbi:MAG: hypothetical protein JW776_09355 [Candidatus Lokiarchaeota archaeon]|nr:hypothetical protein [Candidatus Lokiarchaeota archaeon]
MKISKKMIKYLCIISFGANIALILMGIFHYFIGLNIVFGTSFSILIVLSWFLNIILIVYNDYKIVKSSLMGKKIHHLGYGFVGVNIIDIILLVAGLFLLNANWFSPILQYSLIIFGFFSFFIYGSIFSYLNLKSLDKREVWQFE